MDAKFLSDLILRDVGGGRFALMAALGFYSKELDREVYAPVGYITDLASIPPYVPGWMVPKLGDYDYPAVIHDAAYDLELQDASGKRIFLTKDQADKLFLEGMAARGVNVIQRRWMYLAVHWFGRGKFSEREVSA
jgi:hypothetical protein